MLFFLTHSVVCTSYVHVCVRVCFTAVIPRRIQMIRYYVICHATNIAVKYVHKQRSPSEIKILYAEHIIVSQRI